MAGVRPDSRADKVWATPANRIPVGIECDRAACPMAAGTGDRIRLGVARVRCISWSRGIVVRLTVGYSASDDGASGQPTNNTYTYTTAVAARISGSGDVYGTCCDGCSCCHNKGDILHGDLQNSQTRDAMTQEPPRHRNQALPNKRLEFAYPALSAFFWPCRPRSSRSVTFGRA